METLSWCLGHLVKNDKQSLSPAICSNSLQNCELETRWTSFKALDALFVSISANSNATITVVALLLNKPVLSYGIACSYFKYFCIH